MTWRRWPPERRWPAAGYPVPPAAPCRSTGSLPTTGWTPGSSSATSTGNSRNRFTATTPWCRSSARPCCGCVRPSCTPGQVVDAEHAAVLDWLRGDLRQISVLKSALIFRRIGRHNARHVLFSLAHWLAVNDRAGLALVLDIRRLGFARRPGPEERQGHYYTKAALLDAYEVLRQLVDNTDEMANCMAIVLASPAFLSEPSRGLDAYQALKLRIFDEVRDANRDNPFSSLIRLGAA